MPKEYSKNSYSKKSPKTVTVGGYTRKDGTRVPRHTRSKPSR